MMQKVKNVPYLDIKRAHKNLIPEFVSSLKNIINDGKIVLGPEVNKFEKSYAEFSSTKYCAGVASGLDALIISLLVLGIEEGDEVIVPSNTYIATLLAVSSVGASPILVEPKMDTYNLDPEKIEGKVTKRTKVIIPVHLYGQSCEMDQIIKIARKYKLFIVEDNAQSHGAKYNEKPAGSFGEINATSFYPGKNLGALGEGGAITTNSKIYYEKIKVLRNYGSKKKYLNEIKGFNSRLDELQAGFLSIKLKELSGKNKKREKIANLYISELNNVGDLILPITAVGATHVYHVFNIRTKKRNQLQQFLAEKRIDTMIHYPVPPHMQKAYKELRFKRGDFPIAEELAKTSLSIPVFPEMTSAEQDYVIKSIKSFYAK